MQRLDDKSRGDELPGGRNCCSFGLAPKQGLTGAAGGVRRERLVLMANYFSESINLSRSIQGGEGEGGSEGGG